MLKIKKFDNDYGYIKQRLPDKLVFNINNEKDYSIYESALQNKDYKIDSIHMKDSLIGIIESDEIDYYIHIKNKKMYVTPYLNGQTEGSLNISIDRYHDRFTIDKTLYSYLITDNYTNQKLELDADIFFEGRKAFITNAVNKSKDPFVYLKITFLKYTTFLEFTNSKKDFAFKTINLNILTSSLLTFDLKSANELIVQAGEYKQVLRINDLNKNKDAKLIEKIKNYVQNDIIIKVNKKLYVINERNDKLSIKTDAEKQLLYKHSNISFKKKGNCIKINGEILYNTKIKPNTLVTKDGVFLSDVTWVSEKEFISEFKIRKLIKLNEIHNTVFFSYK